MVYWNMKVFGSTIGSNVKQTGKYKVPLDVHDRYTVSKIQMVSWYVGEYLWIKE